MATYRVNWSIDLEADAPRAAAEEALRVQRDPQSIATVFQVQDMDGCICDIDLLKPGVDCSELRGENEPQHWVKGGCDGNGVVP
jgi:hypothetical protein